MLREWIQSQAVIPDGIAAFFFERNEDTAPRENSGINGFGARSAIAPRAAG
jgi:hypothetical protein